MEHTEGWLRHGFFVYWISKFVELMDTMYMIARHKSQQISFLHVWHHSSITLLAGEFDSLLIWKCQLIPCIYFCLRYFSILCNFLLQIGHIRDQAGQLLLQLLLSTQQCMCSCMATIF